MDWLTDMGSGNFPECRPFLVDNHGQGDIQAQGQLQWVRCKRHIHLPQVVECMYMSPCGFGQDILHLGHTYSPCRALCILGSSDYIVPYPDNQSLFYIQQEGKKHMDFLEVHVDKCIWLCGQWHHILHLDHRLLQCRGQHSVLIHKLCLEGNHYFSDIHLKRFLKLIK